MCKGDCSYFQCNTKKDKNQPGKKSQEWNNGFLSNTQHRHRKNGNKGLSPH